MHVVLMNYCYHQVQHNSMFLHNVALSVYNIIVSLKNIALCSCVACARLSLQNVALHSCVAFVRLAHFFRKSAIFVFESQKRNEIKRLA
jgi:hypothetical protein